MVETNPADRPGRRIHRRLLWAALVVAVAGMAFILVWFQPHKLFIDDSVDEAVPTVSAADTSGDDADAISNGTDADAATDETTTAAAPDSTEPLVLATGEFISRDHGTSGTVQVLELPDGSRYVRLEALDTDNGPDLYVYLSTNPAGGDEDAFEDNFIDLGRLKGNKGDQNYELAGDVDLGNYSSVVIWCDRFSSAFGAADLAAVSASS